MRCIVVILNSTEPLISIEQLEYRDRAVAFFLCWRVCAVDNLAHTGAFSQGFSLQVLSGNLQRIKHSIDTRLELFATAGKI